MEKQPGRLSSNRWNRIVLEIVRRYDRRVKMLVNEMMVAGNPPFTVGLTEREQYDKLLAMQAAGDPGYWNDKEAQGELLRLSNKFGQPPDLTVGPFGDQAPNNPYYQYAAPEAPGASTDGTGVPMSG